MSDILYDARLWLEGRPRRTRTHWDDCHLASGHTECLVRKLLEKIELLQGYRDEAESEASIASLLVDRSRLTDDEQAALQRAIDALYAREDLSPTATADDAMAATRLARLRDRLKPIKSPASDRSEPIAHTPLQHTTPAECSTRKECTEPVAWALMRHGKVEKVADHPVYLCGDIHRITPLYAHQPPMLTDVEREAVEWALRLADAFPEFDNTAKCAAVLRGLLERTAEREPK